MDLTFTDEQEMVAEVVRDLLRGAAPQGGLARRQGAGWDDTLWDKLAAMGLCGVLAPGDLGGLDLDERDFVRVAEACGEAALAAPLVEHAGVATPFLTAFAADSRVTSLIADAATGRRRVAIAHPVNLFVADANSADFVILHHEGAAHLVARDEIELSTRESADPFRRIFSIDWTPGAATLLADAETAAPVWARALDRAALFAAAQALGGAARCLELAVSYVQDRRQFGRPIGANQAVKHALADIQVRLSFARPVVYAAAAALADPGLDATARVSHAKLVGVEAAAAAARTALHVHGAMGYSWEVDAHFHLKRALVLGAIWGDSHFHARRVAKRVFDEPIGPGETFARIKS